MDHLPRLSVAERDRRWSLVRERMAEESLECLILVGSDVFYDMGMANVRFLTQIGDKSGAFAVFPAEGEPVVWVGLPHTHRPESAYRFTQDWVTDIRVNHGPAAVAEYVRDRFHGDRIGFVGWSSRLVRDPSTGLYQLFRAELPRFELVYATGLVNHVRLIKSAEEIAMLEHAGRLARGMLDTLVESAEPGRKECEVYAEMVRSHIAGGGEAQIFLHFASGPLDGGRNDKCLLHGHAQPLAPTTRVLEAGDVIVLELHANHGGYLAAAEFSLFLGTAPAELRRIHEVQLACEEALEHALRPGATFREVWEAQRRPCEDAGLDFVELGFHDHGLVSGGMFSSCYRPGEPPLDGRLIGSIRVRENMVFGTNVDIFDPRWKPDVGLMFGDMLHVTADGARPLVNTPTDVFEV
jgi:Xaa-Pro aminopeptidase